MHGYTEGSAIKLYARESSEVSFVMAAMDNDTTTADTLYRIDMAMAAEADLVDPQFLFELPGITNYYYPHTAPDGVTGVTAYKRVVYEGVYPNIDFHLYSGSSGPRMCWVVWPGGDVDDIYLHFAGHDSLRVDWDNILHLYLNGQQLKLDSAKAYQYQGSTITPIAGGAQYVEVGTDQYVTFAIDSFDTALPLVIQVGAPPMMGGGGPEDPRNLQWSTYANDGGGTFQAAEVDEFGNVYACGYTSSAAFPIAPGTEVFQPFDNSFVGDLDAVIIRYNGVSKQIQWGSYYGGGVASTAGDAYTKANKLAVYKGQMFDHQYVFVTGSTNTSDFLTLADPLTIFSNAVVEPYGSDDRRSWVAAFHKDLGECDWATTHGADYSPYFEEGLTIDVDDDGLLVYGGTVHDGTTLDSSTVFPVVTPAGAYSDDKGSSFFIVFDEDYQIRWATAWGGHHFYNQLADLRLTEVENPYRKVIWITGHDGLEWFPGQMPLIPPASGYYDEEGLTYLARIDVSLNYDVEISTRWGGAGTATGAYGLEVVDQDVWLVGFQTLSTTSDTVQGIHFLDPGGGAHFDTIANGESDGYLLKFNTTGYYSLELEYGTLFGGDDSDVLLDVTSDGDGRLYITGESRSGAGLNQDLDPNFYYEEAHGITMRRDALILGIQDGAAPTVFWNTAYGGTQSDRGWGMAATPTELYLCGFTASELWQDFPLMEWDTASVFDWYSYVPNAGMLIDPTGYPYRNESMLNLIGPDEEFPLANYGAFIASFYVAPDVGFEEDEGVGGSNLMVWPGEGELWYVQNPGAGTWRLSVLDALGRQVVPNRTSNDKQEMLDLAKFADGLYLVVAVDDLGALRARKILKR